MSMDVKLPIDVVPDTDPPVFVWRQLVNHVDGSRVVVDHESMLPPSVEQAVARLVTVAKQLLMENMALQARASQVPTQAPTQPQTQPQSPAAKSVASTTQPRRGK